MLPSRGAAPPAPIHTPQTHNISIRQWHQPDSAPQNAPGNTDPAQHHLLLTGSNEFCRFCSQKQQGSTSSVPRTIPSGVPPECCPPQPACTPTRCCRPPAPPALAPMTYFGRRRQLMPQQRPWSPGSGGCPGSRSPARTPSIQPQPAQESLCQTSGWPQEPSRPPAGFGSGPLTPS